MNDDTAALAWYRRGIVAAGLVTLLIGAHALAATPPPIGIKEFKYGPSMLTRPSGHDGDVGQSRRGAAHRHIRDGRLQLRRARERRHVHADLTKPGTYPYFCAIHPYMKGTLIVK